MKDWLIFGFWALALPATYFIVKIFQGVFADPAETKEDIAKRKAEDKAALMDAMTKHD
jgi:hypothetical protein